MPSVVIYVCRQRAWDPRLTPMWTWRETLTILWSVVWKDMHRAHRWSLPCPPSEVCHFVTFQWYAACLCITGSKLKLPCPRASLVFSWRQVAALPRLGLWRGDPSASLCTGRCTYGLGAQGHPGLLHPRWRLARWHAHWHLEVSPLMVTWMLSQLYCSPSFAQQCMGYSTYW